MKQIGEVLKSLKLGGLLKFEPYRINKLIKPEKLLCPACGNDYVNWFWLESEAPEILQCQWKPHLCRCMILNFLRGRRNMFASNLSLLGKAQESGVDKQIKDTREKIVFMNKVIRAIEGLKTNEQYYRDRFNLADDLAAFEKYGDLVWWWLFDCRDKEETSYYLKVLELEQPVLEKIGEKI